MQDDKDEIPKEYRRNCKEILPTKCRGVGEEGKRDNVEPKKFDPLRGMNFEELQERVLMWAKSQDLLYEEDADEQFMEFIVSVFDFKSDMDYLTRIGQSPEEIYSDYEQIRTQESMELEMGRIIVKLVILCKQLDIYPIYAMRKACSKLKRIKS